MLNDDYTKAGRFASSGEESLQRAARAYRDRIAAEAAQAYANDLRAREAVLPMLEQVAKALSGSTLGLKKKAAKELLNEVYRNLAQKGAEITAENLLRACIEHHASIQNRK